MLGKLSGSFSRRLAAALKAKQLSSAVSQLEAERFTHTPVMLTEVIDALNVQDGQTLIDFTFGAGGHSKALLSAAKDVKVFGVDRDPTAYRAACSIATEYPGRLFPVLSRFSEVEETLEQLGVEPNSVDGAILDCGCSSMQFDDPSRGFALSTNGPLDMRMDAERYPNEPTAADVVNSLDYESLARILKVYGEEKKAKKVAQAIVDSRFMMRSIDTTWELAQLVETALSDGLGERRDMLGRPTHLATKTFMALRIFVNDELNELNHALTIGRRLLRPGGRLAVLSFHSLEDRLVKRHFQGIDLDEPVSGSIAQKYRNAATWHGREEMEVARRRVWEPIGTLGLPSVQEVERNPRSRSAKLRVAAKLP
ncbi:12S rRNA N4-methylcytidine methyltransferase [Ixodes scapularis]|uniref:12S rRNA N4-methylcytidine methyltransferase n=1 Tax=Ixodes scapularis TaxID=6945 RepID=UPI001A9EC0E6|nr:12S rRNA N4-methylcytidine methyltransferase [Ixodes scapularis]